MVYVDVISNIMTSNKSSDKKKEIIVYPNPATNQLAIGNLPIGNWQFTINDAIGKEIYCQNIINSTQSTIDISYLNNGVYFYQLSNSNEILRGKFVKE